MREILFKGKRADNEEWVEGFYFEEAGSFIKQKPSSVSTETYLVIPETVSQFIGLRDSKRTKEYPEGQPIFEGDIIRYAYEDEYRMYLESLECPDDYSENAFNNLWTVDEVVYCVNVGYPAFDLNRHSFEINGLSELTESGCYHYEVIGNIHDNPELLKGGAEE